MSNSIHFGVSDFQIGHLTDSAFFCETLSSKQNSNTGSIFSTNTNHQTTPSLQISTFSSTVSSQVISINDYYKNDFLYNRSSKTPSNSLSPKDNLFRNTSNMNSMNNIMSNINNINFPLRKDLQNTKDMNHFLLNRISYGNNIPILSKTENVNIESVTEKVFVIDGTSSEVSSKIDVYGVSKTVDQIKLEKIKAETNEQKIKKFEDTMKVFDVMKDNDQTPNNTTNIASNTNDTISKLVQNTESNKIIGQYPVFPPFTGNTNFIDPLKLNDHLLTYIAAQDLKTEVKYEYDSSKTSDKEIPVIESSNYEQNEKNSDNQVSGQESNSDTNGSNTDEKLTKESSIKTEKLINPLQMKKFLLNQNDYLKRLKNFYDSITFTELKRSKREIKEHKTFTNYVQVKTSDEDFKSKESQSLDSFEINENKSESDVKQTIQSYDDNKKISSSVQCFNINFSKQDDILLLTGVILNEIMKKIQQTQLLSSQEKEASYSDYLQLYRSFSLTNGNDTRQSVKNDSDSIYGKFSVFNEDDNTKCGLENIAFTENVSEINRIKTKIISSFYDEQLNEEEINMILKQCITTVPKLIKPVLNLNMKATCKLSGNDILNIIADLKNVEINTFFGPRFNCSGAFPGGIRIQWNSVLEFLPVYDVIEAKSHQSISNRFNKYVKQHECIPSSNVIMRHYIVFCEILNEFPDTLNTGGSILENSDNFRLLDNSCNNIILPSLLTAAEETSDIANVIFSYVTENDLNNVSYIMNLQDLNDILCVSRSNLLEFRQQFKELCIERAFFRLWIYEFFNNACLKQFSVFFSNNWKIDALMCYFSLIISMEFDHHIITKDKKSTPKKEKAQLKYTELAKKMFSKHPKIIKTRK